MNDKLQSNIDRDKSNHMTEPVSATESEKVSTTEGAIESEKVSTTEGAIESEQDSTTEFKEEMCLESSNVESSENNSKENDLIESLQQQINNLEDRLKRALAEQHNQRQRMLKEKANADRYGAAKLASDLLGVIDNLERALHAIPNTTNDDQSLDNLTTGVKMVQQQMMQVLNAHHIYQISPEGEQFDYNLHESIAETDSDNIPANKIIEVVQIGYMIHDRLLRPAKVIISSGKHM